MKINHMNCTIELTKAEMKAAETFGSQMYKDLREARQDNPNYRGGINVHPMPSASAVPFLPSSNSRRKQECSIAEIKIFKSPLSKTDN